MKPFAFILKQLLPATILLQAACHSPGTQPNLPAALADLNLKRGQLIVCSPEDKQLGTVDFATSCPPAVKPSFDLGMALLHSFEYDEAEKAFASVIDQDPGCAMAYWGVAMSNYHQVWPSPPADTELIKGSKAIAIAQSLPPASPREAAFIAAMARFYQDWQSAPHRTRSLRFAAAMENLYKTYPNDKEAAIFYALSLDAVADPADKTYQNQKKAGAILTSLYPGQPNHPGIVHYIIHSYDYPSLAKLALPAARKYASIAPASAHALHMPSHIFTRLGLWDECISSNLAALAAARCYAANAGIKGHWDEELHGLDYLVYAYLQQGRNKQAWQQVQYVSGINEVYPANFKVAYAFAAIPARYYLENKRWKEAAGLRLSSGQFNWQQFPWQKAMLHYARLLGAAHTGQLAQAKQELDSLRTLHNRLLALKDTYKAGQVAIQVKTGEAWLLLAQGNHPQAIRTMEEAATQEDNTEKSPVTPGEVLPAKELLADMLLQTRQPAQALEAYEANLHNHPNRLNGLYGAAVASEQAGQQEKAATYYQQLLSITRASGGERPELEKAKQYLAAHKPYTAAMARVTRGQQ